MGKGEVNGSGKSQFSSLISFSCRKNSLKSAETFTIN